ncbi:MAG: type I DNA topoisomerase [Bacteroidales bacterium]|nr:type I DNA topoisomerase [Bacteroidales bacterium]
MEDNLVIVESPAKAKTIKKFLGKNYLVKSSYGHIRDLEKKNYGIDISNDYQPKYVIPENKKEVVKELKELAKKAKVVWLATDEDREGEAIAWHLYKVLDLTSEKTRRIVFHEITQEAIRKAIENPRAIDMNLVKAQQARRILDRLVGFELSPVLWKKIKPSLSAGRVQSAALRLIVEREREIMNFTPTSSFSLTADFTDGNSEFKADLSQKLDEKKEALKVLEHAKNAEFHVDEVNKKPSKRNPAPPFTTSTLQQEASRKLGFSVARTMSLAQRLYEAGKITYMRTDSVSLSNAAIGSAKKIIQKKFGEKYLKTRQYQTKSKGAQEAHEAIRPTYMNNMEVSGSEAERKLYNLIWKRTIASQMSSADFEKTTIKINISNDPHQFVAKGEVLIFDGFLKVYMESTDEEKEEESKGLLPEVKRGQKLSYKIIKAIERFTHHPPRYTEASLVKKLEELGIGRPSTYAPIISTVQERGYVVKEDRYGTPRNYREIVLEKSAIKEETRTEMAGAEKGKLFPNDIGMLVNDFLKEHFKEVINYNFTANVEEEFDQIAEGFLKWSEMIDKFYQPFHEKVEETLEKSGRNTGERILGTDPKTGRQVAVKIGPYGPMVQLGTREEEEKPKFASLQKGQHIETITLEEALKLFDLPRKLGTYEGNEVIVSTGRYGPYIKHNSKNVSLKREDDPFKIDLDRAIQLIEEKRERDRKKTIKSFSEDKNLVILKGRFGPYISYKDGNYPIPKKKEAEKLTLEECYELINNKKVKDKQKQSSRKQTSGKTASKGKGSKKQSTGKGRTNKVSTQKKGSQSTKKGTQGKGKQKSQSKKTNSSSGNKGSK